MKKLKNIKNLKNRYLYYIAAVLVVFSATYFIFVGYVSHYFDVSNANKDLYDKTVSYIKRSAEAYGERRKEIFNESGVAYIKVQDLVDNGFIVTDMNGNVVDYMNEGLSMNDNVID